VGPKSGEESEIREPEVATTTPEPEVEVQEIGLEDEMRVVIVGAGGFGRVALDVLLAGGFADRLLGFYDDAHAVLPGRIRGYPVLGDVEMLKSMLSVEPAHVVVAVTDNGARLRIANAIRRLDGRFFTAAHPLAYVSDAATVGDGCVLAAGAVIHPDASVGSHCYVGPGAVIDRDAEVGAGVWFNAGAVVGAGAEVGARAVLGANASIGRKATVGAEVEVEAARHVAREGG
jgi:sugar O-acyltransferase (sialic acid O-acetyltransferase NeuD family)